MRWMIWLLMTLSFAVGTAADGQLNRITITPENVTELIPAGVLGHGFPSLEDWSADGRWLVISSSVGVWLYDTHDLTAEPSLLLPVTNSLPLFAMIAPDSRSMAVVSCLERSFVRDSGTFCTSIQNQIFALPNGEILTEQINSEDGVIVAAAYNGEHLITVFNSGRLRSLTRDGDSILILELDPDEELMSVRISPNADRLAFIDGSALRVWDLQTLAEVWRVEDPILLSRDYLRFSVEGDLLLRMGNREPEIMLYKADDGDFVNGFKALVGGNVPLLHFTNERLLLIQYEGYRWTNPNTGQVIQQEGLAPLEAADGISGALFSPDEELLAYTDTAGNLRLYSFATQMTTLLLSNTGWRTIFDLSFTETSGELLARTWQIREGGVNEDRFWWDVTTQMLVDEQLGLPHPEYNELIIFGDWLITIDVDTVTVTERKRGTVLTTLLPEGRVHDVAISPDGRLLVTAGCDQVDYMDDCWEENGLLTFWDTATWTQVFQISELYYHLNAVAFSRDGTLLATGGFDGVVRLWHVGMG